jgi:hypothetical protein
LYLYPEITELCRHTGLSDERTYGVDNRLALVPYEYVEVDTAACRAVDVQQVSCFPAKDGLDQQRDYCSGNLKKMGHKKKQKSSSIGLETNINSTSIGPSFTTFITPIANPYELCVLEVGNQRSHRKKAKKLTRKTQSLKRKSRQMGNQSGKHSEIVIVEYSVSGNGIKNKNAIIRSGRELVREDEASSSIYRPATNSGDQANEPAHLDNWAELSHCLLGCGKSYSTRA